MRRVGRQKSVVDEGLRLQCNYFYRSDLLQLDFIFPPAGGLWVWRTGRLPGPTEHLREHNPDGGREHGRLVARVQYPWHRCETAGQLSPACTQSSAHHCGKPNVFGLFCCLIFNTLWYSVGLLVSFGLFNLKKHFFSFSLPTRSWLCTLVHCVFIKSKDAFIFSLTGFITSSTQTIILLCSIYKNTYNNSETIGTHWTILRCSSSVSSFLIWCACWLNWLVFVVWVHVSVGVKVHLLHLW